MSLALNLSPSPSPSPHPSSKALLDALKDVDIGGEISTLMKYIDDRLKGVPIYESPCRIWLRRSAVATGFTLIGYGIPSAAFIMLQNLALVLGKKTAYSSDFDLLALTTVAVTGDVLCTIAFDTNATLGLVKQTTRALSREEEILLEDELSLCQKIAAYTAAVAGALFAKFPEAWGAYNAVDPKLPPFLGYSMQQVQIAGPAFSLLLTFLWLPRVCRFSYKDFEQVLENAKKHFAAELKCRQNALRVASAERQNLLSILGEQIDLEEEDRREATAVLQALFDAPAINNTGVQVSRPYSYILDFLAACLTGFFLTDVVEEAHEGADTLIGDEITLYIFALMVALSITKLVGSLIRRGLELPYEGLHPASHAPITKELRPGLYKTCTAGGMICTLTPAVQKFAGNSTFGSAGLPLGIMGSIGAFFLSLATVHQFRDGLIKSFSQNELLTIADQKIEEIHDVIVRTKVSEFARFLKDLTLAQRQGWAGAAISDAQLNDYLA